MEHDWDDQPYGTTGLKYYVSTDISGSSSVLCNNSTRNFLARNITDADYDWDVGPGISLNSDGNYNTSVTANSSYSGETWIEVEITSPLGGINEDIKTSKRFVFWVGKPTNGDIDFGVYFSNPPNNVIARNDYEAIGIFDNPNETLQGVTKYNWQFGGWSSYITNYQTYPLPTNSAVELYLDNYASGSQIILVSAENTCGTDMMMAAGKMFVTDDYGMYMTMSPNPTSTETTLTIESTSKEKTFDENAQWELEIYSPTQTLKEKKTKLKGKSTTIQTYGWKEGVYVVRVKYNPDGKPGEILTGKLVVKK